MEIDGEQAARALNENMQGHDRALGFEFAFASPDRVEARLVVRPDHCQPYGIVHGGVHCAVIEATCSTGAAMYALGKGLAAVGLDNHTSFVRAVRGGTLRVEALPIQRGGRSQLWEARITDEGGRLIATGRVRMLCIEPSAKLGGDAVGLGPGDKLGA